MASKSVLISDISGNEIKDGEHTSVLITKGDAQYVLDANFEEVRHLTVNAHKRKKRGRKAKASARV